MGVLLCILSGITLLLILFSNAFVTLIASGFESDPNKFELTAQWFSGFSLLMGLSVASLFSGHAQCQRPLLSAGPRTGVFNIAIITACLLSDLKIMLANPPLLIAIRKPSGFLSAAIQYPSATPRVSFPTVPEGTSCTKQAFKFGLAAIIGVIVVQFNLLVETQLASTLGDGPVSHLTLSFRFIPIPQGIVASSIAIALLRCIKPIGKRR